MSAAPVRDHHECVAELLSPEGVRILLLGTAHISRRSVEDAQALVREYRPSLIFVELCASRASMLAMPIDQPIPHREVTLAQIQSSINSGGVQAVAQLLLSDFAFRAAQHLKLEVNPGAEFAAAVQLGMTYGARVFLGDRDVRVTLKRAWAALSTWECIKLVYSLMRMDFGDLNEEMLEKMKTTDMLSEMFEELAREMPSLMEPLIHERDRFLAYRLRQCCTRMHLEAQARGDDSQPLMLAVVGMGHVRGIKACFSNDVDEDDLTRIAQFPPPPPARPWLSLRSVTVTLACTGLGVLLWRRWR